MASDCNQTMTSSRRNRYWRVPGSHRTGICPPPGQGLDLLPFRSQVFDAITHTDVFC